MSRRLSRETAMQILFQVEVGKIEPNEAFQRTVTKSGFSNSMKDFTHHLVFGTLKNKEDIDKIISELSKGWRIDRIANIDKTIMRMALYEILFEEDIPLNVSVNEAIELAKVFGGEESGKFVNGILGKVVESPEVYKIKAREELEAAPMEL
ncbi:transcription antitermination factor NusB [Desulfolucanica intricata]|uniref:transcription antitermination factor NusB n=1 Tax=Desulfolucanica intricata TaxID=1285191 RepID=UPI0008362824|nr:transcription antitermination factor NusB [Desulfolucanica intricata]